MADPTCAPGVKLARPDRPERPDNPENPLSTRTPTPNTTPGIPQPCIKHSTKLTPGSDEPRTSTPKPHAINNTFDRRSSPVHPAPSPQPPVPPEVNPHSPPAAGPAAPDATRGTPTQLMAPELPSSSDPPRPDNWKGMTRRQRKHHKQRGGRAGLVPGPRGSPIREPLVGSRDLPAQPPGRHPPL